jgi:RimJ/RimL family protein N-acetyltransferase
MSEKELQQKFGARVDDLEPAPPPREGPIDGDWVTLTHLQASHAKALYAELIDDHVWDYLGVGPFETQDEFCVYISRISSSNDPFFYAIISKSMEKPVGYIALMRMAPTIRICEIGHVAFSPKSVQQTRAATEVFYLLLQEAFGHLRSRRVEWKCNTLNEPSKRAAERLGFQFEGVFRKHSIVKGRNRDSAWYSMLEDEWPEARKALKLWLDDHNFDEDGKQQQRLALLRQSAQQ